LLLQKKNQKKEPFTKVFFMLFYRMHKNRLQSAKFFPGLPDGKAGLQTRLPDGQEFLTRFLTTPT
jgi:hypothetical protein